jgi:hypothetical protein
MNKNTSIVLIAAVAGIMVAGALAVMLETSNVYALTVTGKPGGVGNAGQLGGTGINGGTNADGHNSPRANGGSSDGGAGAGANGGDADACDSGCGANS